MRYGRLAHIILCNLIRMIIPSLRYLLQVFYSSTSLQLLFRSFLLGPKDPIFISKNSNLDMGHSSSKLRWFIKSKLNFHFINGRSDSPAGILCLSRLFTEYNQRPPSPHIRLLSLSLRSEAAAHCIYLASCCSCNNVHSACDGNICGENHQHIDNTGDGSLYRRDSKLWV